ncbi:MAG: sucrase ferredoxin [Mycobacteriales bacterium]
MSQPSGADRCAPAAQLRGDDLPGTAAPVSRWLLIEQPGRWGRDALRDSHIEPDVTARLAAAAKAARVRIVLIRRPGRVPVTDTKAFAYVDSRSGREQVRWGSYRDHDELLGVFDGTAGEPSSSPVYLVCAHGRHDVCCAMRGRPVAAELNRLRPGQAWECSHIGGDRFAANVVVLPQGLYYGHVSLELAAEVVASYDRNEVVLPLLRGRSSFPAAVQAAQQHARVRLAERRIDALMPLRVERATPDTWRVALTGPAGDVVVTVRAETAPPVRLTCSSLQPESVRIFRPVGWEG